MSPPFEAQGAREADHWGSLDDLGLLAWLRVLPAGEAPEAGSSRMPGRSRMRQSSDQSDPPGTLDGLHAVAGVQLAVGGAGVLLDGME
jgi:hypothetical protein